jgi:addiction module HigA family antidote
MARTPTHPGEILAEELRALGVSPTEFARQIRVPANRVSQIIHGKRSITGDTALRLGHWFGTSPQFWMNLQGQYDVRIAEQQAGPEIKGLPTKPSTNAGRTLSGVQTVYDEIDALAKATAPTAGCPTIDALSDHVRCEPWQIRDIHEGIREADAGEFAAEDQVKAVFAKHGA